jgi:uncharacterized paraquat-inducible protein A
MRRKGKTYLDSCQCCNVMQGCKEHCKHHRTCEKFVSNELGPKPRKTKALCGRCYNNFYNSRQKDGCWSFKDATVVAGLYIPSNSMPPPFDAEWQLSCFR